MKLDIDTIGKILSNVSDSQVFLLENGIKLRSLHDLVITLEDLPHPVFVRHVNSEKNDFSNWIRDVIKDEELAGQISDVKSKKRIVKIIGKRINQFNRVIERENSKHDKALKKMQEKPKAAKAPKPEAHPRPVENINENSKIKEIIEREKEIEKREEKILEIEGHIEKKILEQHPKFFTKEFVQGIIIGILVTVIIILVILRFINFCE